MEHWITIIKTATITLPALEITVLLTVLSVCLVFYHPRVGLIAAYACAYRWGWSLFVDVSEHAMLAYLIFGTCVGFLTVVGMMRTHHE